MTAPATAARSGTHPVGPHLLIAPEETAAALTPVLSGLPPLPGALLVLAAAPDAAPVLRHALPDLVALAAERGANRLVLAASGLAAQGPGGRRPVQAVAATADFPVVAPDAAVSVEPDGTLRLAVPGAWWLAGPGEEPVELGPGWPPQEAQPLERPERPEQLEEEPEERQEEERAAEQPAERVGEQEEGKRETGEQETGEQETGEQETGEPLPPPAPPVPVVAESGSGAHRFGAAPKAGPRRNRHLRRGSRSRRTRGRSGRRAAEPCRAECGWEERPRRSTR
ncbi:hypothetical protein ACGF1Z_11795 [Streptomyces sp. NPDC048018]|uniref:hypothetical protein n=1 Tax=Streptomyces sp. NPDC048018 TaxID=3365499 RepID=UPI0037101EFD